MEHVTGYKPSYSYKFDVDIANEGHKIITDITEGEKTGDGAVVSILSVMLDAEDSTKGSFTAYCRSYSVVPSSEGDDTSVYTYSGSMTSVGEALRGKATTTDGWQTAKFTPDAD